MGGSHARAVTSGSRAGPRTQPAVRSHTDAAGPAQDAVATRKKVMKQKEMVWRNSKELSELEESAQERAQNVLQRANKLRLEQEEELKDMSKVGFCVCSPLSVHTRGSLGPSWRRGKKGRGGGVGCADAGGAEPHPSITGLLCDLQRCTHPL